MCRFLEKKLAESGIIEYGLKLAEASIIEYGFCLVSILHLTEYEESGYWLNFPRYNSF